MQDSRNAPHTSGRVIKFPHVLFGLFWPWLICGIICTFPIVHKTFFSASRNCFEAWLHQGLISHQGLIKDKLEQPVVRSEATAPLNPPGRLEQLLQCVLILRTIMMISLRWWCLFFVFLRGPSQVEVFLLVPFKATKPSGPLKKRRANCRGTWNHGQRASRALRSALPAGQLCLRTDRGRKQLGHLSEANGLCNLLVYQFLCFATFESKTSPTNDRGVDQKVP